MILVVDNKEENAYTNMRDEHGLPHINLKTGESKYLSYDLTNHSASCNGENGPCSYYIPGNIIPDFDDNLLVFDIAHGLVRKITLSKMTTIQRDFINLFEQKKNGSLLVCIRNRSFHLNIEIISTRLNNCFYLCE